jgi:hypothetical protein
MTYDFSILLSVDTLQGILYGTEEIFDHCDQAQNWHLYTHLKDNGIWSTRVFTNTDILFVFESGIDMLENIFEPYVFVNPHNGPKVRTIPGPFKSMKCDIPHLYFSGPRKID